MLAGRSRCRLAKMLAFSRAALQHHSSHGKHPSHGAFAMKYSSLLVVASLSLWFAIPANETATPQAPDLASRLKVPPGFIVEVVAAPPLVNHPMMANFDERGRLFLAESSGLNLKADELLKVLPNKVLLLEGVDAKGRFTKSRVFADKMTFPSGALWHNGALYVTAAPHIWKMRDTKNVGVADERTELVSKFNFIGNAADLHGPFLGPDGRIYWCDGRHGHEIKKPDGSLSKGKAARIFRCKPDGSDVEVVCGGGMDNPVEIVFTDECEPLVTVDILHNFPSRNDGIIFAIEGGNYPWHEVSKEFPRTGDLLPAIADLGWVAPSGLMRYRSDTFGKAYRNNLFSAQFNRHRIQRHIVERAGASFTIKTDDFLTSDDKNFHPTDVFEDADGSLIVIDTGGWFRIGCPTSQIARPEFKGAIYRIRKADAKPIDDPRGLKIAWSKLTPVELVPLLDDPRVAVRDRAIEELANRGKEALPWLEKALQHAIAPRAVPQCDLGGDAHRRSRCAARRSSDGSRQGPEREAGGAPFGRPASRCASAAVAAQDRRQGRSGGDAPGGDRAGPHPPSRRNCADHGSDAIRSRRSLSRTRPDLRPHPD